MPTEKQQWLDRYDTYHAATEYNRQHYGKRIKQLKHMLEDENFLEFLSNEDCKQARTLVMIPGWNSVPEGWFPILFNDMIDNGMRNGIPNEFWKDVITVYDDGEIVQQFTGNQKPLNCRVILLDSSGKVIFFHDRGFSVKALNQLREKI